MYNFHFDVLVFFSLLRRRPQSFSLFFLQHRGVHMDPRDRLQYRLFIVQSHLLHQYQVPISHLRSLTSLYTRNTNLRLVFQVLQNGLYFSCYIQLSIRVKTPPSHVGITHVSRHNLLDSVNVFPTIRDNPPRSLAYAY